MPTTARRVLLSGSAIGFYGDPGDEELDETSPAGHRLPQRPVCDSGRRRPRRPPRPVCESSHLRTGIVLSADGGALKKQLPLFKLGLGNKMGSGTQWQSWISIDDEVGAIDHLLTIELSRAGEPRRRRAR